jgi:hypothetical protein
VQADFGVRRAIFGRGGGRQTSASASGFRHAPRLQERRTNHATNARRVRAHGTRALAFHEGDTGKTTAFGLAGQMDYRAGYLVVFHRV